MIRRLGARASWVLVVAGCELDEPDGSVIAIGNPPTAVLRASLAAPGEGVVFDGLTLPLSGLYLEDCDGAGQTVDLAPAFTVGLRGAEIEVRAGDYCALGLIPVGDAELVGAAGEGTFRFANVLPRILVYGDLAVHADEALVLELAEPAWIDAAAFALEPGEHREIGGDRCSADPLCARILTAMTDEAGLYGDDGDGTVDDVERARGERARGTGRTAR